MRATYHTLVFYGFAVAFLSTVLAFVYQEFLGRTPPFALTSAPVVVGIVGGVAMIIGCTGLLALKAASDPAPGYGGQVVLDYVFLVLLDLASATGLLLLALRGTSLVGTALIVHLGVLAGLYATAPYGKFAHFVYRYAALVQNNIEERESGA